MSGKEVRINMKRTEIVAKTEELVTPIIEENHFELVDVEYVREGANWYLRIYADKEGGINIDDCVLISRALEEKLDAVHMLLDILHLLFLLFLIVDILLSTIHN